MEDLVGKAFIRPEFWTGRRVLVTGHTGFWGGWLCATLVKLGAEVHGFSLAPATRPNLFEALGLSERMHSRIGNILHRDTLQAAVDAASPVTVFHLAAQALVRKAYADPIDTFATNVMGTAHVLEAVRHAPGLRGIIAITTDKVYDNRDWPWPYRENDRLGGREPYGASKACAEHVVDAYRASYFSGPESVPLATVRAGNLVGGGDWSVDRIVPDAMRAFVAGKPLVVRRPEAVRPWQHVIEAVRALLLLAQAQESATGDTAGGWNFGPEAAGTLTVREVAKSIVALWGEGADWQVQRDESIYEARLLTLDSSRARSVLGWQPVMDTPRTLAFTVDWYRHYYGRGGAGTIGAITNEQIDWMLHAR